MKGLKKIGKKTKFLAKKASKLLCLYLVVILLGLTGTSIAGGLYYAVSQLEPAEMCQGWLFHWVTGTPGCPKHTEQ